MCGIVGVIQYQSKISREVRHRALKILFSETMLKTETRGRDATGLYQVHEDGDWMMTKKGQKVTDWLFLERDDKLEDPIVYSEIMSAWIEHPKELRAIVGHCRAATVGSKGKDNNDNHPFAVQLDEHNALLGIHNGTLINHELIFKKLPDVLPRHGNVDSEAIFHFMYHLTNAGQKPVDGEMLQYLGKRLDGAYAVIMMNSRFPEQVVTFRKERPMEYFLLAPLNMVVVVSDRKFVESALEKYEFIRQMGLDPELPKLQFATRTLLEKDYRIFDTSKEWPATGTPIHGDFDKISQTGSMLGMAEKVLEDWAGTEKSSSASHQTPYQGYAYVDVKATAAKETTPGILTPVKTTKKSEPGKLPASAPAAADDAAGAAGAIVEIPITATGSEAEAAQARQYAKALGVMVEYDTPGEIAKSLGVDEKELGQMRGVDLANRLAQFHFSFGYGAARLQNKRDGEDLRKKAQDQTAKMECALGKQRKAQYHIWEQRQVITILLALHAGGYALTSKNVARSLSAFAELQADRRTAIQKAATNLMESPDTLKLVENLVKCFKETEKKSSEKKSSEFS